MALTQRDRDILDFERSWWTATSPKDVQIRERFELSTTRYHQILNEMLDTEEAMAYDPLVVRRLHRQRDRRRRARLEPRVIEEDGTLRAGMNDLGIFYFDGSSLNYGISYYDENLKLVWSTSCTPNC